ncbi:MAG: aldehyde dehydrogenase family protein, partial [Anaerolineales bacterium]|nr:aldehyde dehydrogenase family protein [Anaerolineales bacterium]
MELANMPPTGHFIGGKWVESASGQQFETMNPATEEVLAKVARGGMAEVEQAVAAARQALSGPWGMMPPKEHGRFLHTISQHITAHAGELARLETLDNGKPLSLAEEEVRGAARYFEYYAGAADKIHGEQIPLGPNRL